MKIQSISILVVIILLFSIQGIGQKDSTKVKRDKKDRSDLKEKLVFGGNLGLSFGNTTFIEVSPTIGYKLQDNLLAGVGLNFNYYENDAVNATLYGPSLFMRYNVIEGFFLHSEFQQTFTEFKFRGFEDKVKTDFPMLFIGGGAYSNLGGNTRIGLSVLFDILEDPNNTFYDNPVIRLGITAGF